MNFTTSFLPEAFSASTYLALKLFLIFSLAKLIYSKWTFDYLSSLIAGWLFTQVLQIAIILGLSSVELLHRPYFVTLMIISAVILYWRLRIWEYQNVRSQLSLRENPAVIAIGAILLAMWLRSLFLYDFTWDAQTYGFPRLVLWMNSGSVFLHMPTLQLNLWVNEWNAELNSLSFALVSGAYLGFAFGNLEVLLWLFISIVWVARLLGVSTHWAIILSAVLGSSPAMLGLSTTIKGDLLAVTAFIIAFGWLIKMKQSLSFMAIGMFGLATILAVGSKISAVFPVLAIVSIAFSLLGFRRVREFLQLPKSVSLAFLVGLLVFSSRFWANWILYGNPLKRINVEQTHFSLAHMFANLDLVVIRLFSIAEEVQGKGAMWALAGSMGGTAWFIVIAAFLALIDVYRKFNRTFSIYHIKCIWLVKVEVAIFLATIASMTLSEAYPWNFRYFAPGIFVILIGIGALGMRLDPTGWHRYILIGSAAIVIILNICISSRSGEVLPTPNLRVLVQEILKADSPLKRMSLFVKGPYQIASVEALGLDSRQSVNILAFKGLETSFVPFLGSHAQNNIQIVSSGEDLVDTAARSEWDVVAILQKQELRDSGLNSALEQLGYLILVDNSQYLIALPKARITLIPLNDLKEINWSPWNSVRSAKLSIRNGLPEIESAQPVDSGLMSQEFHFQVPILVKASFEGEIIGSGDHAAHLSIYGKQPVITLAAGSYKSSQVFWGIVSGLETTSLYRLVFGLGGWAEGKGHLHLTGLEVFQLQITNIR